MADSNSFIMRGDDGTMYRVTKDQLAPYKLGPDDPAQKNSATYAKAHDLARKATASISPDFFCFLVARESGGPPKR